jgi:2-keto-3-deoxy-L-arabinonate dehydratase
MRYCRRICEATDLPVLIQDFNPGGPSVDAQFCVTLTAQCQTFHYLKLEEPMLATKLRLIREATRDQVKVLAGWGGMYTPELLHLGLTGVMPGLAMADLIQLMFDRGTSGDSEGALDVFGQFLPQVVFSLQNIELFLVVEKMLLEMRGIIGSETVRSLGRTLDEETENHARRLNERVSKAIDEAGLEVRPRG